MRARNIKPGFFVNENLSACDPLARILFIGLWCLADREGRLEDRPRRIKAELLPYDDTNVDLLLGQLERCGFILRYAADGARYIQVMTFSKHQYPHIREPASTIPAPDKHSASTVQAPDEHQSGTVLAPPYTESRSWIRDPDPGSGILDPDLPPSPPLARTRAKGTPRPSGRCSPELPDGLDRQAWEAYLRYRREAHKPTLKPASQERLARWLAEHNNQQAAIVDQTVRNGWTGLFELRASGRSREPRGMEAVEALFGGGGDGGGRIFDGEVER